MKLDEDTGQPKHKYEDQCELCSEWKGDGFVVYFHGKTICLDCAEALVPQLDRWLKENGIRV